MNYYLQNSSYYTGNLRVGSEMAKILAIPYWSFKEKIRITKMFERKYHIEDLAKDAMCGVLYMERKENIGV